MVNPEIVAELRRLQEEHGELLTASAVVEAARPVSSILHSQFTWDDTVAAQQYRIHQARQLIRVVVEYIGEGDDRHPERVFVSVSSDRTHKGGGYRPMAVVLATSEYRAQLLEDALEDAKLYRAKYEKLVELSRVFDAMREAEQKASQRKAKARKEARPEARA